MVVNKYDKYHTDLKVSLQMISFLRLLQNNQISSLANGTFTGMTYLKYLYVFYGSKYF